MSTHHILLIEDDASEAHLAQLTLKRIDPDLKITRLHDGAEFLEYYANNRPNENISLAIMDLHMPSVGGMAVLEKLQEEKTRPDFPIVLFTSSEDTREVARAYQLGGSAFVTKPPSAQAYRKALRDIINFWIGTNRLK